jgi:hypothetical protein
LPGRAWHGIIGYLPLSIDYIFARSGTQFALLLHVTCVLVMFFLFMLLHCSNKTGNRQTNWKRAKQTGNVQTKRKLPVSVWGSRGFIFGWLGGYAGRYIEEEKMEQRFR